MGTVIERADGEVGRHRWTKLENGNWESDGGSVRSLITMQARTRQAVWAVARNTGTFPTGDADTDTTEETPSVAPRDTMTVDEFKSILRTTAWASQQGAGVNRAPVANALAALSVTEVEPMIGVSVNQYDHAYQKKLPDGTVLATQRGDTSHEHYTVYVWKGGTLRRVLGNARGLQTYENLYIIDIPGGKTAPWLGSDAEPGEVLRFKQLAWKQAMATKRSTGWCGEVESAMSRCSVDAGVAQATVDPLISPEAVAARPVGTLLRYGASNGIDSVLYVRDDSADNPAKTRRVVGTLPGSWSQHMAVVWRVEEPRMQVKVLSKEEMRAMPVGTVVAQDRSSNRWRKVESPPPGYEADALWRPQAAGLETANSYHYRVEQFGMADLSYVVIP